MYIGLDLGTSGLKGVLIDDDQRVLAEAVAPLTVSRPQEGWSEQSPAHWIAAAEAVMDQLATYGLSAVRGIGLSGQMHGATLLDSADEVLRPCILWNDTRSFEEAAELDADPQFRRLTGNIVFPGFTAPKLLWVQAHERAIRDRVAKVLLPKDYLRLWLTGEHVAEMSDAAGTSWLDVGARDWSDDLLTATGLDRSHMPRLVEGSEVSGELHPALSTRWGLPGGQPVGEESSYSLIRTVKDAIDETVRAYQGEVSLLRTGIEPLDAIIKGLAPGDLTLLAGATSMGKTALALEIASNCAYRGDGVVFVSLEMARDQLANRMIATKARIPYTKLRDAASLSEDEMRKWVESSAEVAKGDMRIVPKHIRDVPAIYSAARRCGIDFKTGKPSLLVVDYAQLVRGQGKSRYEQMTDVSISLKHLGGMLGCPVIALVQLSRDIGTRDDKRPQLFDIKETGQFENDADQVAMCHREEYWLARQGPKPNKTGAITAQTKSEWEADLAAVRNRMEILVRKNRHGKIATAEVGFNDATNRFWKLGQEQGEDFR